MPGGTVPGAAVPGAAVPGAAVPGAMVPGVMVPGPTRDIIRSRAEGRSAGSLARHDPITSRSRAGERRQVRLGVQHPM